MLNRATFPPVTLSDIEAAHPRIASYVRRTPLARSETLSQRLGTNIYLKAELFQKTGAFKVRGAFNRMLSISGDAGCSPARLMMFSSAPTRIAAT